MSNPAPEHSSGAGPVAELCEAARLGVARQGRAGHGRAMRGEVAIIWNSAAGLGMAGRGWARQGKATEHDKSEEESEMKLAVCRLKSASPYSQGRHYQVEKLPRELPDDYEKRTWRNRMHVAPDGVHVQIPPMAFANTIKEAAKYQSEKIPGQRNATWTKHFDSGILVSEPLTLPDVAAEVRGEWLFVPADGRQGSGTRVSKCFPFIPEWGGDVTFYIMDDLITREVFERTLVAAGMLIGIGRFRPSKRGYYGRFTAEVLTWDER